ncbi:DUF4365 domain-containing protein (plasmid) [Vibrio metschnikovii]
MAVQHLWKNKIMKYTRSSQTDRIGVQTVGSLFARCGYIFREQPIVDCGIDAQVELVDDNNQASGEIIALQIKSGASWFKETTKGGYVFRGEIEHLEYWLNHSLPVVIVLCDIDNNIAYWQSITKHTVKRTGKAWKVIVPFQQEVNVGMNNDLRRLAKLVEIIPDYTVTKTSDNSHGGAKRYTVRVTLSKEHSQAELLTIIRILTEETKMCEYHRSDRTRDAWKNKPADVVWLFIYPTSQDERHNNYLCKSEWIDPDLEEHFRPCSQNGQDIGDGVNVEWNSMYLTIAKHNHQNEISKGTFIQFVDEIMAKSSRLCAEFEQVIKLYTDNDDVSFQELCQFIETNKPVAHEIYEKGASIGLSSYECKEASIKFQSMIAHLDNMFILPEHPNENATIFNLKNQAQY